MTRHNVNFKEFRNTSLIVLFYIQLQYYIEHEHMNMFHDYEIEFVITFSNKQYYIYLLSL